VARHLRRQHAGRLVPLRRQRLGAQARRALRHAREIKNLNSFKFLQQAIDYEIQWQIDLIEDGGQVQQATVLFNPDTGETRAMRTKEDAHDYRYFPDPDLPPLVIAPSGSSEVRARDARAAARHGRTLPGDYGLPPTTRR
jgi:aspartyl-tRNA(Asn)/glutamyl-tRNA(Gln) amidotransferase subunit B